MQILRDDLWFCVDCTIVACNGDYSGIDSDERVAEVNAGLERLGPHVAANFDSETGEGHVEFSNHGCDCCGSPLAGEFHRFAILGE
jgi:hypothetical protein